MSRYLLPFAALAAVTLSVAACDADDASTPLRCGPCGSPPASSCDGDSALTVYASPGFCDAAGACVYPKVRTTCALGCADDACQGDPCAGVTCDDAPGACHIATGTCAGGVCSYALADGTTCDDGDACTDVDSCGAGTCAGTPVACDDPPASRCVDSARLATYANTGACADDTCTYAETIIVCPDGCDNDGCVGDPCAGVVCDDPPSGCFAATGTCADGVCDYAYENGASCNDGDPCTTGDQCTNGVCGGAAMPCDAPPAATCAAGVLTVSSANGTCAGGSCSYPSEDVTCSHGCGDGTCAGDPCEGVTCDSPEPPGCDSDTLTTSAAEGTCSGGACSYTTSEVTCPFGCDAGACNAPVGYLISEILYNTDGSPDVDSFVELFGPAGGALTGVTLVGVNGNGGADYGVIELAGTFDEAGLFVVAHPNAAAWVADMADMTSASVDYQNGPDAVQLRYGDLVLDAVAYGDFGDAEATGGEGTPHAGAAVDESLARDDEQTDTNDNAADFRVRAPTPGVVHEPIELIIGEDTELCEAIGVDRFVVQGGATVSCAAGALRVEAREIFIDPASTIDVSATSAVASGTQYGFCTDGQLHGAATGGGGGGNGTVGSKAATVEWEKTVRYCSGGHQCYDDFCVDCSGGGGGGVRGSSFDMGLPAGGRGGDGCYDSTSTSPGSYSRKCDPSDPPVEGAAGGGTVWLQASEKITVLGSVLSRGGDAQYPEGAYVNQYSPMSGGGGGAGGSVMLLAPTVDVQGTIDLAGGAGLNRTRNYSCGVENTSGGAGGDGRIKVLYTDAYDVTGTVSGAVESVSYMPPQVFTVQVDDHAPDTAIVLSSRRWFERRIFQGHRPANALGLQLADVALFVEVFSGFRQRLHDAEE